MEWVWNDTAKTTKYILNNNLNSYFNQNYYASVLNNMNT